MGPIELIEVNVGPDRSAGSMARCNFLPASPSGHVVCIFPTTCTALIPI